MSSMTEISSVSAGACDPKAKKRGCASTQWGKYETKDMYLNGPEVAKEQGMASTVLSGAFVLQIYGTDRNVEKFVITRQDGYRREYTVTGPAAYFNPERDWNSFTGYVDLNHNRKEDRADADFKIAIRYMDNTRDKIKSISIEDRSEMRRGWITWNWDFCDPTYGYYGTAYDLSKHGHYAVAADEQGRPVPFPPEAERSEHPKTEPAVPAIAPNKEQGILSYIKSTVLKLLGLQ